MGDIKKYMFEKQKKVEWIFVFDNISSIRWRLMTTFLAGWNLNKYISNEKRQAKSKQKLF